MNSEETLILQLLHPFVCPLLAEVILVILIKHASDKFTIFLRLGSRMLIPFRGNKSINLGTGLDELIVQLASSIAIIIRIRGRIPNSKDGDFFALNVSVGERAVEPIVPGGSRALIFGVSVPGGGSYDEGIGGIDVGGGGVGYGRGDGANGVCEGGTKEFLDCGCGGKLPTEEFSNESSIVQ